MASTSVPSLPALLREHDRPAPRYTSYPTAIQFTCSFGAREFQERLARASAVADAPLSLYVHLPFCEHRCTYCGCMAIITRQQDVADRYLGYLEREMPCWHRRLAADAASSRFTGAAARRRIFRSTRFPGWTESSSAISI